jgi:putative ABC transport system ATP-binding protein
MSAIISVENVTKTYRIGKVDVPAVRGVSFSVETGEFVSVVGPSGSGKSTLFYMLGGLTPADRARADRRRRLRAPLRRRAHATCARARSGSSSRSSTCCRRSPRRETSKSRRISPGNTPSATEVSQKHVTGLLGIDKRLITGRARLSGGEQQRVALARALVNKPAIVLADEPTGNLDTKNSEIVLSMLRRSNKELGQTVLMITHNPEAARYGDRILHIRDGELVPRRPAVGREGLSKSSAHGASQRGSVRVIPAFDRASKGFWI